MKYICSQENENNDIGFLESENVIWYIFIFLSVCNIYITNMQKESIKDNSKRYLLNNIHNGNMLIFIVVLIIYIYFFKFNYNDYKYVRECGDYNSKENSFLTLVCNILFIIAGVIAVYVEQRGSNVILPLY